MGRCACATGRHGQALTQTASARNTTTYRTLLETLDYAYPQGDLYLIADNLSSHTSGPIRDWLAAHPHIHHVFIPVGAAWLNRIEGWWRIFRRKAFAGQSLADHHDIAYVTRLPPITSTAIRSPGSGDAHRSSAPCDAVSSTASTH